MQCLFFLFLVAPWRDMNVFFCVTVPQARLTGTPDRGRLRTTLCIIKKEKNYNNFPKKKGGKKNASRLDDPFVVDVASTCLSSEEVSMEMTPPPPTFFFRPCGLHGQVPPPSPLPPPPSELMWEEAYEYKAWSIHCNVSSPPLLLLLHSHFWVTVGPWSTLQWWFHQVLSVPPPSSPPFFVP